MDIPFDISEEARTGTDVREPVPAGGAERRARERASARGPTARQPRDHRSPRHCTTDRRRLPRTHLLQSPRSSHFENKFH